MKKIIVIALYEKSSKYYKEHLESIFGSCIEVVCYFIEDNYAPMPLGADLILVTSHIIYAHIKNLPLDTRDVVIIKRTFSKAGYNKLLTLKTDEEVLFVSTFFELAVESAAHLYELGIQDVKFIPYNPLSPYKKNAKRIKTAVTAGEAQLVPDSVETIVDLGNRVLDILTIADIGARLGLPVNTMQGIIKRYKKKIAPTHFGLNELIRESNKFKEQMKTILNFVPDSIIATDTAGVITEYNEASATLFGLEKEAVIGRKINTVIKALSVKDVCREKKPITNILLKINSVHIVSDKYPFMEDNKMLGVILINRKYMELENKQVKLRSKLISTGHTVKYTFNDILGVSDEILKMKKTAQKMSKTSRTILITGESGTGKEIFAQALHSASDRSKMPFVAINCATLSATLLESELFGYEEGAFTGAKKGGKIGLFEVANGGSLFLDEVGEIPYALQAKLLRVLDEKKVMRVGGTGVIQVDTRVIAATNRDLTGAVEEGTFRSDLFYRLNVFPLNLPPLRERAEDVAILFRKFIADFGRKEHLSETLVDFVTSYDWPGNIRELKNCAAYMCELSGDRMTIGDLPPYIMEGKEGVADKGSAVWRPLSRNEQLLLNALCVYNAHGKKAGRRLLSEEAGKMGVCIPEQEVRYILKSLEEKGLVVVHLGRRGTEITPLGLEYIADNL